MRGEMGHNRDEDAPPAGPRAGVEITLPSSTRRAVGTLHAQQMTAGAARALAGAGVRGVLVGGRLATAGTRGAWWRRGADAEVLVRATHLRTARTVLVADGWTVERAGRSTVDLRREHARLRLQGRLFPGRPRARAEARLGDAVLERATADRHGVLRPPPHVLALVVAARELLVTERPPDAGEVVAALEALDDLGMERALVLATATGTEPAFAYAVALRGTSPGTSAPAPPASPYSAATDRASVALARGADAARERLVARRPVRHAPTCTVEGVTLAVPAGIYAPSDEEVADLARPVLARIPADRAGVVADVGTGSGAIALVLARARPRLRVVAVDPSPLAVRTARANARRLGERGVDVRRGSLLDPLRAADRPLLAVVTNVPFVMPGGPEPTSAPARTFFGPGVDGLDLVRRLAWQAAQRLEVGGWLTLLADPRQFDAVAAFLDHAGFAVEESDEWTTCARLERRPPGDVA